MRWWVALALLVAGTARADVVEESGGTHHWPGRGRVGPESCTSADTRQGGNSDGTWAYFVDALPTCPMGCPGGPGAWCVHERGAWNCCAGVPPPTTTTTLPVCTFMQCPPPTVVIGHDATCGDICSSDFCTPNPCQNGGLCLLNGNGFVCLCPCNCSGTLCETCVTTTTTTSTTTTTAGASTTTGTGPTTTSTTTTTTSSTTTTTAAPPVFPSTTFLVVPEYPTDDGEQLYSAVASTVMICGRFASPIGINNATKLAANITQDIGFPFRNVYVGLYPDDDNGTRLARVIDHRATPAIISNTGLPAFSILPNTVYRACACEVSGTFANTGAYEAPNWLSNGFASEQNAFVFSVGTAAVTCGTGGEGVPDHTGALTQDNSLKPPILLISRE